MKASNKTYQNNATQNPHTQVIKKLVLIRRIPRAIKVSHNVFITMIQLSDMFSFML